MSENANEKAEEKKLTARHWLVLANVSVGTFMATLDASVVNVALPTIEEELQSGIANLQWVVTAYLLTIASLLLVFGRLSDMVGRKKVYATGFVIFTLGSALCSISQEIWQLISFRVLQGTGASMMMANALALITQVFPDEKRGRALGVSSMTVSLGILTGPALGGLLVGFLGWRAIFWINIPLGILGSLLAFTVLPQVRAEVKEKLDWLGAVIFAAAINCLVLLSVYLPRKGWDYANTGLILVFTASCLLFYLWEKKAESPLVDLDLFKNRSFAVGNGARALVFIAQYPVIFLMPFYLQHVRNFSPQEVGAVLLFYPAAMAVCSPVSGRLSDVLTPKIPAMIGLGALAAGQFFLCRLDAQAAMASVYVGLLLVGAGMGLFQPPNNSLIMGNTPANRLSISNALISVTRNIGTITGTALAVFIFSFYGARGGVSAGLNPEVIVKVVNSTLSISLLVAIITAILMWRGFK